MYDIVIIGAGTAGLTAAVYGARAGKSVLVVEAENFGGQITASPRVENYPGIASISGNEFAANLLDQALGLGVQAELERVIGVTCEQGHKLVITEENAYPCLSVIVAAGVKHRTLGLAREAELTGEGVSYCAVCDGAFFKGRDVAVVGGGSTAVSDALFLSEYCRRVTLIHRREQFRAEEALVRQLRLRKNVDFLLDSRVTALQGGSSLEGVRVENLRAQEERFLAVEGLFVAVGQVPDSSAFAELLDLDADGYLIAGEDCRTSCEGIFAAGDCRTKQVRQLTTAAGDGAVAGLAAVQYIQNFN